MTLRCALNCHRLVDGENDIVQSHVILRYIARKHGLLGSTEKEQYTTGVCALCGTRGLLVT